MSAEPYDPSDSSQKTGLPLMDAGSDQSESAETIPGKRTGDGAVTHKCYCGKYYDCPQCSNGAKWACSTVNGDEDGNMCDPCLDKFAQEYQEWYDQTMKSYFYIQAIVTQSHEERGPFVEPGGIEFRHCRVQAKNITKAYSDGFKVLGRIPDGADAMNDYVISLEDVE